MPINPVQLSYSQNPQEAFVGSLAEGFVGHQAHARFARGMIKSGYGVFRSSGSNALDFEPGEVWNTPVPGAAAAVSAIHAGASSASIQTITSFGGTFGSVDIQPPRQVTITFDGSTDWDPTSGSITYVDSEGAVRTQTLAVATSAALTTTFAAKRVVSITLPAQTGAGGTFTVGTVALAALTAAEFDGVAIRQLFKRTISSGSLYGLPGMLGVTGTADYVDGDSVSVLTTGGIWVYSEAGVQDGSSVYVRTAANGGLTQLGAFAPAAGTGLTLVPGARFVRNSSGAGAAWARFNGG